MIKGSARQTATFDVQSTYELFEDQHVEVVLQPGVFDARIQVGIVVDFNHHHPLARLFEVDAVQAVADELAVLTASSTTAFDAS